MGRCARGVAVRAWPVGVLVAAVLAAPAASAGTGWVRVIGGPGREIALGLAPDGRGGVVVSGAFDRTLELGGSAFRAAGPYDAYLARLDGGGHPLWVRRITGPTAEFARMVALDGAEVVVTGYFGNFEHLSDPAATWIDTGTGRLQGAGGFDGFVARFDLRTGRPLAAFVVAGPANNHTFVVRPLPGGDVAVAGDFSEGLFGLPRASGSRDGFVARLGPLGQPRWVTALSGPGEDLPQGLVVLPGGDLLVAGSYEGSLDAGGIELHARGPSDGFVARLDASTGRVRWAQTLGGDDWDAATALTGSGSQVVVAGEFWGSVRLGPATLASAGGYDAFVASLDPATGNVLAAQRTGGGDSEHVFDVAAGPAGPVLAGWIEKPKGGREHDDGLVVALRPGGGLRFRQVVAGPGQDWMRRATYLPGGVVAVAGWFTGSLGGQRAAGGQDAFVAAGDPPLPAAAPSWIPPLTWAGGAAGVLALAGVLGFRARRRATVAIGVPGQGGQDETDAPARFGLARRNGVAGGLRRG